MLRLLNGAPRHRAAVGLLALMLLITAFVLAFRPAGAEVKMSVGAATANAPPTAVFIAIAFFAGFAVVAAIAITSVEIQANPKGAWYGLLFSNFMFIVEDAYGRLVKGVAALLRRSRTLIANIAFASATSTNYTFSGAA